MWRRKVETAVIHSPTQWLGWSGRRAHHRLSVIAARAAAIIGRQVQLPVGAGKPCGRLLQLGRPIRALLRNGAWPSGAHLMHVS